MKRIQFLSMWKYLFLSMQNVSLDKWNHLNRTIIIIYTVNTTTCIQNCKMHRAYDFNGSQEFYFASDMNIALSVVCN